MTKRYPTNRALFDVIALRLRGMDIVTHREVKLIVRRNTCKERYWRRHIIDLCDYAFDKMERESIDNAEARKLCLAGKELAKNDTTDPHKA